VAPTQLHPNTWSSIQAFCLICGVLHLHPTPSCFLNYYTSHPTNPVLWHSLISQLGNVIFNSFATSYKKFKKRFFKVCIRPEATSYFFDEISWSRFSLYLTKKPRDFKEWPRPAVGAEELDILSFFDTLPRKLPTRKLVGVYAKSSR